MGIGLKVIAFAYLISVDVRPEKSCIGLLYSHVCYEEGAEITRLAPTPPSQTSPTPTPTPSSSHTFSVWSKEPETTSRPSALSVTDLTESG